MRRQVSGGKRSGFTILELVIALLVFTLIATIGVPLLLRTIQRVKLEGFARQTFGLMQLAKAEAVRQNVQTVVRADFTINELVAFADVDGVAATDPPDLLFNPVAGRPNRTTDYLIARYPLPAGVQFAAPSGDPADRVDGFTTVGTEEVAVFQPDGSIQLTGAFRLADTRSNFLEVRVAPQATARVQVQKYDADDDDWYARGESGPWHWN